MRALMVPGAAGEALRLLRTRARGILGGMSARVATFLIFVANGAMVGFWLASIPWIAGNLDATKTQVGFALLASALGALISMTLTGQLLTRLSSRRLIVVSALVFPLFASFPVQAPTLTVLVAGMVGFGAINGVMDVAMNAHGVAIERRMGRPVMSSLHAGWSLGSMLGAASVALAAMLGIAPQLAAPAVTVVLLALALLAFPFLGDGAVGSAEGGTKLSLPSRAVLPLGLLAVLAAVVEGGIGDWAGLYLERDLGMDSGQAALGFTAFALGLTAGRLAGDLLNHRYGAGRLLRWGLALTAVALGGVLAVANPSLAIPGLVVCGVGVANAIPLMFSAGGHIKPSGPSLAAVFTMAYTAFMAGPPIVGFIADHIGLPPTMALLMVVAVVAAILAPNVPGIDASNELSAPDAEPAAASA